MRLFLALKPDRAAEAQLGRRLLDLQAALGELAAPLRWTPASNIHATLHFLGELAPARVPPLQAALEAPIAEPPFEVAVGAAGAFPNAGPVRVVWLDVVKGAAEVARVHAELARRLTAAGFSVEARPFSPHLTIARVPDRERSRVKPLRDRLTQVSPALIQWRADHITLFRSDLTGAVPRYEGLQDVRLG